MFHYSVQIQIVQDTVDQDALMDVDLTVVLDVAHHAMPHALMADVV